MMPNLDDIQYEPRCSSSSSSYGASADINGSDKNSDNNTNRQDDHGITGIELRRGVDSDGDYWKGPPRRRDVDVPDAAWQWAPRRRDVLESDHADTNETTSVDLV